ncbi:MAG: hypothetical protein V1685_02935 [Parcubacteria group bacterium]
MNDAGLEFFLIVIGAEIDVLDFTRPFHCIFIFWPTHPPLPDKKQRNSQFHHDPAKKSAGSVELEQADLG